MPPFEIFEIDRSDMCLSVAMRHDFAIFVAQLLNDVSHGNPALNALVCQLRSSVDIMYGSRRKQDCAHLEEVDVIGTLPVGALENRRHIPLEDDREKNSHK